MTLTNEVLKESGSIIPPPPFYSWFCCEKSPPHIVSDLSHSEKRGFHVVDVIKQLKLMLKDSWSPYKV